MTTVPPLDMFQGNRFIFFDESGNMEFSPKSSKFVVVLALNIVKSPEALMEVYWQLRHGLFINPPSDTGTTKPYRNRRFHAAEDPQVVRNKVYNLITDYLHLFSAHAIVLDKNEVFPFLKDEKWLYEALYYFSLRSIVKHSGWLKSIENAQLLIDQTQESHLRKSTVGGILKAKHEFHVPHRIGIHHVSSLTHPFLQFADYFGWAIYKKHERDDLRSYDLISKAIDLERSVFKDDLPG